MSRPPLSRDLPKRDFRAFYWLKAELVGFCRAHGLPTAGPKAELAERVAAYLADGRVLPAAAAPRAPSAPVPDALSRETRIGRGWRCGQRLRAFFEREVGPGFRFNQALVAFVRDGEGRTLGEALDVWAAAKAAGPGPIAPQFEYNRHTRAYYREHPGVTRAEVLAAWQRTRAARSPEPGAA